MLHVGDTVEWDNADIIEHTATASDGSFNLDLAPGAHGSAVVAKAGEIPYVCTFHPGMTGRLVVSP